MFHSFVFQYKHSIVITQQFFSSPSDDLPGALIQKSRRQRLFPRLHKCVSFCHESCSTLLKRKVKILKKINSLCPSSTVIPKTGNTQLCGCVFKPAEEILQLKDTCLQFFKQFWSVILSAVSKVPTHMGLLPVDEWTSY